MNASLLGGVPVEPDAATADRWLERELAHPVYAQAEPGVVARVLDWLWERLSELTVPTGYSGIGIVVIAVVVGLVVVLALRAGGRWRGNARARRPGAVLTDPRTSASGHRENARRAQAGGRLDEAVREWFRAVVRGCEERALLTERVGRTADEAAQEAAELLPSLTDDLAAGARLFDEVTYGTRRATATDVEVMRRLDASVAAARPVPVGASA